MWWFFFDETQETFMACNIQTRANTEKHDIRAQSKFNQSVIKLEPPFKCDSFI